MSRRDDHAKWAADMLDVQQESGGLMSISVVPFNEVPALLLAVLEGDREAVRLSRAMSDFLGRIERAGDGAGAILCGCCSRRLLEAPFDVALAMPALDNPAHAIALGICKHCAPDAAAVSAKAFQALQGIFPDARPVGMQQHAGGHA